ncbi:MAG: Gx transporter family protein [Clostridia bacterium]|nr:Gx transporter family protein [Clostridia bacterium]
MNKHITKTRKIGIMAIFVAIGMVLQYAESRLIVTSVPGGKLGLANVVTIINIFMFGNKSAILISVIRATLGCLISGGITALPYSLSGAFFSTLFMCLAKKLIYPRISTIGISVIGAAIHNISQIFVAALVFSSWYIFSYLPALLVVAVISGVLTGYTADVFSKRILKEIYK